MSNANLGRLASVDLRSVWTTEAGDFTPWLAQEGNLSLLGDTIGVELDLEAQEKDVGPFRADMLCKDTGTDRWVLIENQLERTDHAHLGQLLTYAAGLKAVTIVWIADRFTEEHRAALDWLNEITNDRFNFFGLEVELWRIGDSPVAPKFNVACKPNDWTKSIGGAASTIDKGQLSERRQLQLAYWTAFRELLLERRGVVKPQKAHPQHWANFAIGRSNFHLWAYLHVGDQRIGCGLVATGSDSTAYFRLLHDQKEEIEAEIGKEVEWRELPNNRESQINLHNRNVDLADRKQWPGQHEWLCQMLEQFHGVFAERVKSLDIAEYQPTDEEARE